VDDLYLPHTCTWSQAIRRDVDEAGIDGSHRQATGVEVSAMFDPLTPRDAELKFGVVGTKSPFLVFLDPAECEGIQADDVLMRDSLPYLVKMVKRFDMDADHYEVIVDVITRGRA